MLDDVMFPRSRHDTVVMSACDGLGFNQSGVDVCTDELAARWHHRVVDPAPAGGTEVEAFVRRGACTW